MEYTESSQQLPGQAKRLATENPPGSSSVSLDGRLLPSGHCCHICHRTQLATVCKSVGESADRVAIGASAVSLGFYSSSSMGKISPSAVLYMVE